MIQSSLTLEFWTPRSTSVPIQKHLNVVWQPFASWHTCDELTVLLASVKLEMSYKCGPQLMVKKLLYSPWRFFSGPQITEIQSGFETSCERFGGTPPGDELTLCAAKT